MYPSEDVLIVGKDDGTVSVYSALSGQIQNKLYSHAPMFVRLIATSSSNAVASVDASGMVMAYEVDFKQTGTAATSKKLLRHHFDQLIQQLLLNCAGDRILICIATHDYLWGRTVGEGFEQTRAIETPSRSMWKWGSPAIEPEILFLIADQVIRRFEWGNLKEMIPSPIVDIGLGRLNDSEIALSTLRTDISGMFIVAEFTKKFHAKGTERLTVWKADATESQSEGAQTEPTLLLSSKEIKHFLGMFEHNVVFLDHHLWVCSIDFLGLSPGQVSKESVKKYFFIPLEFLGGNEENLGSVSGKGNVVFAKEGEVAVVREGLKWSL
jgi:hypothetical protein